MIKALKEYQTKDARLKEIENILLSSEERKKRNSAKKYILGVEENVNKLDDKAIELKATLDKIMLDGKKLEEQQQEIMQTLDAVADEKEVQFLIKKVDEILAKIKALNADAEKISKEMQSVVSEYEKIKKTTKVAQVQYKENADKYKALESSYQAEKEGLESELKSLSKEVEPSLMERYLKKRADKMYPILYAVKNDACGACRMNLSMSDMNKLKNGEVIDCEQCGRMIYLEQ
ncbi:MAG: hypothetical protein E7372_01535 [Clostridiales bacterium]|nr:hypothetical protein [Clostridiales bacterium]